MATFICHLIKKTVQKTKICLEIHKSINVQVCAFDNHNIDKDKKTQPHFQ